MECQLIGKVSYSILHNQLMPFQGDSSLSNQCHTEKLQAAFSGSSHSTLLNSFTLTLVVYLPPSYQGYCPCSGGPF